MVFSRLLPRHKLAWMFVIASLLGLGLSGFIASSSREANRNLTPLIQEKLPLLEDIGHIERCLLAIQTASYQYFSYSIPREAFLEQRATLDRDFMNSLAHLERAFPRDPRVSAIRDAYGNTARLLPQLDVLMRKAPTNKADLDEPRALLVEMSIDAGTIKQALAGLRQAVEGAVLAAGIASERGVEQTVMLVTAYSVLIFVIALLVAYQIRARARAEERLAYNAYHDVITRRLNRRALQDEIELLQSADHQLTVISIERFQRLVTSLGHEVADAVLRAVADRLAEHTAPLGAKLYRMDGASFALLYPAAEVSFERAQEVILGATALPFQIGNHELLVSVTCGSAQYPEHGHDAVTLVRNANTALQHAKRQDVRFLGYTAALNASPERLALESALSHALERQELELFYQPQMDIASGRIVGVEALIRWRRDGQLISPAEFIPLAEESGLIVSIGEWVVAEACRQSRAWSDLGLPPLVVAVNIAARQFQDPRFIHRVCGVAKAAGVRPGSIELEITESAIMNDADRVAADLETLRQDGFALAIDDFGTGYSSLAYLKRFPLDKLKVDQSFVRHLGADSSNEDAAIVQAVVRLGQALGLRVIAEGVETEQQLMLLRDLGCDEIQGYWFSKPLPAEAATRFLQLHSPQEFAQAPVVSL